MPTVKRGVKRGAKEAPEMETSWEHSNAFVVIVSRCLYVLGGGICYATSGVTSKSASRRVSLQWSGEQSCRAAVQGCSAQHAGCADVSASHVI